MYCVEVYVLLSFLTSPVNDVEWSVSGLGHSTVAERIPSVHAIIECVHHKAGLDIWSLPPVYNQTVNCTAHSLANVYCVMFGMCFAGHTVLHLETE